MPASAVAYNVLKGDRPDRPPLGFSNQLWELLEATWIPEHASQPPRRPEISVIIDQLRKDANEWNESMIPPNPRQIGTPNRPAKGGNHCLLLQAVEGADSAGTEKSGGGTFSLTDRSSDSVALSRDPPYYPSQTNSNQAVQRGIRKPKFVKRLRRFFSLGFFKRLRRSSADPCRQFE